ncbi:RICIN domain-containing protein [Streptomyces sp. NPDC048111]|uniref:RICIN domain-containing protein n=1 Tax=Streptomyces sp. NPDC048111 TaxID=3365500 RepID=UPI003718572C
MRKSFKLISVAGATLAAIALSVSPAAANYWNVRLENVWSIKCLGVGSSGSNGAPAIQWDCNGSSDEHWDIVERSYNPNLKEIKNRYSGKCLGVGGQTGNGATIIQWDCNGADDEN